MRPDELAEAIVQGLREYTDEINEGVEKAVNDTAKEVNQEIKNHCTFGGSGAYIKSFALKKTSPSRLNHQKTWHVKKPHYRLTHLLEYGHATRNGGRTQAFPHIKYGEELAERNLENRVREVIERASR